MEGLPWVARRFARSALIGRSRGGPSLARDLLAGGTGEAVIVKRGRGRLAEAIAAEAAHLFAIAHPNLRSARAFARSGDEAVLVLAHVEGATLGAHLDARPGDTSACAIGILRALVHLHARGVVHGDLKPENVLIASDSAGHPVPQLIDLGLAVSIGAAPRGATGAYLPPEYAGGAAASVAGDLFALGRALEPFVAGSDARLARLVASCVSRDPQRRPASAEAALAALGTAPRPLDRRGQLPRLGDDGPHRAAREALARSRGDVVVFAGPRGAGHTRALSNAIAASLASGKPVADAPLCSSDVLRALGKILRVREVEDPLAAAARAAAAAARADVPIVLDGAHGADEATRRLLVLVATTVREMGRGALLIAGAEDELAEELEGVGAHVVRLPPIAREETAQLLEAVGLTADPARTDALHRGSRGLAGVVARAALVLSAAPTSSADAVHEVCLRIASAHAEAPTAVLAEPTPPSRDEAVAHAHDALARSPSHVAGVLRAAIPDLEASPGRDPEAAVLLARASARAGSLDAANRIVEALGPSAPPEACLDAARWLERLGRYDDAIRMAEPLLPNARASVVLAHARLALGDPTGADEVAALALARSAESPDERCRLLCARSDAALVRGDAQGATELALAAESEAMASHDRDPSLLALAISRRAAAAALAGDPPEARTLYASALAAARDAGDIAALPPYLINLATARHALGELGDALDGYAHGARLARALGRRAMEAAALVNQAGLLASIGASDEALEVLADARSAARASASAIHAAQATLIHAEIVGRSSPVRGAHVARSAREAFVACGAARQALEAELLAAELGLDADPDPARALIAAHRQRLGEAGLEARTTLLEARLALAGDVLDQALSHAERAAARARSAGDADLESRALALAADVHARLGTGADEALRLRAREVLGGLAARLPAGLRERLLRDPARASIAQLPGVPGRPHQRAAEAGEARVGSDVALGGIGPGARRLLALVRRLLLEGSEARVLEAAVEEAVALTGAERAFLLRARPRGRPTIAIARNIRRESIARGRARFSRSVAERVLATGEPAVIASATDDPALRGARSVMDLGLRSILCVPIRAHAGVVGALYLDHRAETARFGPAAVELVQALADIIGVALENARLHADAATKAAELARAYDAARAEAERQTAEVERLHRRLEEGGARAGDAPGGMIGDSPLLRRALEVARRVAPSDLPVLVQGESGTGKELLARFVHERSNRRRGPFMAINCAAVPEALLESELFGHARGAFTGATADHPGLFRSAAEGTVFLDEIGEMSQPAQTRLLRVLQEGEVRPIGGTRTIPVDVRVIAATNRDLLREVEGGRFREDLYYRLAGVAIELPPLRDRQADIGILARAVLDRVATEPGMRRMELARGALDALLRHEWPGNVRELQQTLRRAVLLAEGDVIEAADLSLPAGRTEPRRAALHRLDRSLIEQALRGTGGNRTEAAKALGISRVTLHRWMRRHGIA